MPSQLDLARAQFWGFYMGKKGHSVKELAESMGLTKTEWSKLRNSTQLDQGDKEAIDEMFDIKKKRTGLKRAK